jgi:hypothetical protein
MHWILILPNLTVEPATLVLHVLALAISVLDMTGLPQISIRASANTHDNVNATKF